MKRTWLIKKREDAGLLQKELASQVGVTRCYISSIEVGLRNPSGVTAKRIAEALNFPMDQFFTEEQGKEVKN